MKKVLLGVTLLASMTCYAQEVNSIVIVGESAKSLFFELVDNNNQIKEKSHDEKEVLIVKNKRETIACTQTSQWIPSTQRVEKKSKIETQAVVITDYRCEIFVIR